MTADYVGGFLIKKSPYSVIFLVVHPARFERTTFGSASQRSIQLSYGCMLRVYTVFELGLSSVHFRVQGSQKRMVILHLVVNSDLQPLTGLQ